MTNGVSHIQTPPYRRIIKEKASRARRLRNLSNAVDTKFFFLVFSLSTGQALGRVSVTFTGICGNTLRGSDEDFMRGIKRRDINQ